MKLPFIFLTILLLIGQAHALTPWQNGEKFEMTIEAHPTNYAVLERSRSIETDTWHPVAMASAQEDDLTLTDPVWRKSSGYYRVSYYQRATPGDLDQDGIDDLADPAPFNAADATLPAIDGDTFLPTVDRYNELSKRDNFPGAANVREVKILITDIKNEPKLHFMNVNQHQHHHIFARDALGYTDGNSVFSSITYLTNTNRQNLAGSLVFHENYRAPDGFEGVYTLEFWPTDPVSFEFIELAYDLVSKNAPFIDRLVYHAPSETQRLVQAAAQDQFDQSFMHTIETEELFGNVVFQPMNQKEAYGRLVLSTGSETLSARDIVIFRNLPNDLTYISGIITEVPQTPLSHVNLKAQQNNTPNAFIADAANHPEIAPLIGQNVFYKVTPEGFEIRPATAQEVDVFFESIRPTGPTFPPRNLTQTEIKPLSEILFSQSTSYGGKATNLGELGRLLPGTAPEGYGIPFYYYDAYMNHNGFYATLDAMLADPDFQNVPATREQMLADFRETIKGGTMPDWMYNDFSTLQRSFPSYVTPRLRSSANAEDSTNFNGAGLYDSFSHYWREGHISKSVRQVWASLWNYRAYEEREFYRIDHRTSAMGILVHPNEKYEQANGVAIARNIFDPGWKGHYFNVQVGDNLVTNPDANTTPEEFLAARLYGATNTYEVQYIRYSSLLSAGETILTRAQIDDLIAKMDTINNRFKSLYGEGSNSAFAMEIEFKITVYGELSIKQARPYNGG